MKKINVGILDEVAREEEFAKIRGYNNDSAFQELIAKNEVYKKIKIEEDNKIFSSPPNIYELVNEILNIVVVTYDRDHTRLDEALMKYQTDPIFKNFCLLITQSIADKAELYKNKWLEHYFLKRQKDETV